MDTNLLTLIKTVLAALTAIIAILLVRDVAIAAIASDMVKSGSSPVEVRCVLDIGLNNDMICNRSSQ